MGENTSDGPNPRWLSFKNYVNFCSRYISMADKSDTGTSDGPGDSERYLSCPYAGYWAEAA